MENETKIREAEEMIRAVREKFLDRKTEEAAEQYAVAQARFRETDLAEEGFASDTVYWWYRTIRKAEYGDFVSAAKQKLVVSVTSYPARTEVLAEAMKTLYEQTLVPDEVILWLAEDQFPGKDAELPEAIRGWLAEGKLTVRWCEDLKPHKKYFWILQDNRQDITVTVDDDLRYAPDMLEMLLLSYIRHPEAVSAMRVHLMAVEENGKLLPYRNWVMETDAEPDRPGMDLFATTGAGTLYPPGIFSDRLFDRQAIRETCLMADDLWMKANELMEDIPVVLACRNRGLRFVPGSQEESLWETNRETNDEQWNRIRERIDAREGEGALEQKIRKVPLENFSAHAARRADILQERVTRIRREKDELNRELRKQIRELRDQNEIMKAELDKLHRMLVYRVYKKAVVPVRNLFRKPGR